MNSPSTASHSIPTLVSADALQRLIAAAMEPFVCIDHKGVVVLWNDDAERTFEWPRAEVIGKDLSEVIIPERFRQAHRHGMARFLAGGPSAVLNRRVEVFALNKSGEEFPVELAIWPIETATGYLFGAIVRDLRARIAREAPLNTLLAEREAILEASAVGIAMFDGRVIRWVNQAYADVFGSPRERLIGLTGEMSFSTHEEYLRFVDASRKALNANELFSAEVELFGAQGRRMWCLIKGRRVTTDIEDKRSIWVIEDISEQKQAQIDIANALAREKELGELKSRFVSMASHEFRTPLATILSCTQLIESYSERMKPEQRENLLATVKTSVQRMTNMLDDVLLIGKAESGRLEFRPESVALKEFCGRLVDDIRMGVGAAHELTVSYGSDAPRAVIDLKLMSLVINNLLSNAVKYSAPASRIDLHVEETAKWIVFSVSDQGIGISTEDQEHMFETFFRGANIGNAPGTGLGLAIVQRAVNMHRGEIEVRSRPSLGTTILVKIPRLENNE